MCEVTPYMVSVATNHGISVIYHSLLWYISYIYHSAALLISTTGVVYISINFNNKTHFMNGIILIDNKIYRVLIQAQFCVILIV